MATELGFSIHPLSLWAKVLEYSLLEVGVIFSYLNLFFFAKENLSWSYLLRHFSWFLDLFFIIFGSFIFCIVTFFNKAWSFFSCSVFVHLCKSKQDSSNVASRSVPLFLLKRNEQATNRKRNKPRTGGTREKKEGESCKPRKPGTKVARNKGREKTKNRLLKEERKK